MKYSVSGLLPLMMILSCCTTKQEVKQNSPHEDIIVRKTPDVTMEVSHRLCPDDMVEVTGMYCPVVEQRCLYMVDANGNKMDDTPDPNNGRCGEFANPVKCVAKQVHKSFCIDTYEFPNKKGVVPQDWMTWYDAKNACESVGKRLCTRSEWTFAAEGPNMHPLPYGDGFHRDRAICNFDNHAKVDVFKATKRNTPEGDILHEMLVPSGERSKCVSEWGVHDMPGNVDEWVINETRQPYISGLMGGHVFGVRNASRPMTEAHGPDFGWYETGARCCKDTE